MKLASSFLISVALHAAALMLLSSLYKAGDERSIPVALYSVTAEDGSGLGGRGKLEGGNGKPSSGTNKRRDHAAKQKTDNQANPIVEASVQADPFGENRVDERFMISGLTGAKVEEAGDFSNEAGGEGIGGGGSKGKGGGAGTGMGSGGGGGGISNSLVFVRANYAYNPKPVYPERARKEGWEGTVLLRVLVNPQGKPDKVDVSRSSGFEILDWAAMETVKGWRFHPARNGGKQVESWIQVPIVFKLEGRDRGS